MEDAAESDTLSHKNEDIPRLAFDQLVLPPGHKSIVLSLISQHYRNRDSGRRSIDQSDIVRGKGKKFSMHPSQKSGAATNGPIINYREGADSASTWCSWSRQNEHSRFVLW